MSCELYAVCCVLYAEKALFQKKIIHPMRADANSMRADANSMRADANSMGF